MSLLFASTTKLTKSISYHPKPNFGCDFLTKSPRGMGVIYLHRSHGWKDFLYVCVSVCACACVARGRIFYPIANKFGTQVGLVKSKAKSKDGLCRSMLICVVRCRQVELIMTQNFIFGGNSLEVAPRTLEPIFQNLRQISLS